MTPTFTANAPGFMAAGFFTPSGFRLTPEQESTPVYFRRLNRVKMQLAERGIGPRTPVFIAEDTRIDDEFAPANAPKKTPAVCEALGDQAARFLAERTHRLATPAEIERFHAEQKLREEECAAIEANSPENRKRIKEVVHETVVISDEEARRRGIVTTPAEAPARPAGRSKADRD